MGPGRVRGGGRADRRGPGLAPVTLAHNVPTREEVDEVLATARAGRVRRRSWRRGEREWGGYTGYSADPDGFRWEIAWNPGPDRPGGAAVSAAGALRPAQVAEEGLADWRLLFHGLHACYRPRDFATGLRLVAAIGAVAEELDHHPDLDLRHGRLRSGSPATTRTG